MSNETVIRADEGLAFMLRYENIARYENGRVYILDRRIYPAKTEFVECRTHEEVTKAITDMVTQSAGPVCRSVHCRSSRHAACRL